MLKVNILDTIKVIDLKVKDTAVGSLHRPMFKDNPYICKKYFTNEKGYACYECRARLTKQDYETLVKELKVKNEANLHFKTASKYYKDKVLKMMLSRDFGMNISLEGLLTEEKDFRYPSASAHDVYDEDIFREEEHEVLEPLKVALDLDLYNEIHSFVVKAVRERLVMLLQLDNTIALLNNIIEYYSTTGFITNEMLSTMHSIKNKCYDVLTRESVKEWLDKGINDYVIFATDENTKQDYIRTYQGVLRQLSGISRERLDYMKEIVHNDIDSLEETIISNEDIIVEAYQANVDYEGDYEDEVCFQH